jgi:hypothetical protein
MAAPLPGPAPGLRVPMFRDRAGKLQHGP